MPPSAAHPSTAPSSTPSVSDQSFPICRPHESAHCHPDPQGASRRTLRLRDLLSRPVPRGPEAAEEFSLGRSPGSPATKASRMVGTKTLLHKRARAGILFCSVSSAFSVIDSFRFHPCAVELLNFLLCHTHSLCPR